MSGVVAVADARGLLASITVVGDRQQHGACHDLDSEVFFHPAGERSAARASRVDRAKRVCRACPVIRECRDYALTAGEPYGVWGGPSEEDRHALGDLARRYGTRPSTDRPATRPAARTPRAGSM